ncbi:hypothetical protein N657DRAFT_649346 [Parathielavia appendiculata]|uniref:Uncharacterized protein n=1 Tax=Parathielavia appendiculata TaxID=2587402 RepID=A0AAN6TT91_9PEZI|nr:hypothetical protein N657DRAFT_649346 [Parathielavia appendiculata]
MAPRQNTFTLVPNPLGMQGLMSRPTSGPESKPPMTSKQAQKLHKQATRGPRLSRTEQRRIELEEQARIRKELEKDKQANKARILREKKKAKERQLLEEKKRKGLPLVNVRPSQDTIARFVRGNGVGKKRDATGARVGLPVLEEEGESDNTLPDPKDSEGASESRRQPVSPMGIVPAGGRAAVAKESFILEPGKEANLEPEDRQGFEGKPMEEDEPIPAVASVRFSNTHHASEGTPAKAMYRETLKNPSIRQATPERGVLDCERKSATHISPGRMTASQELERISIIKEAQAPRPLPTPRLPPKPPSQHHPSPKPQPPPNPPAARKPLQETTNAFSRTWRLPLGDTGPKLTPPYKQPTLATPRRQTLGTVPTFKQHRLGTPTYRVQKPQFLPSHLRGAGANQRTPSRQVNSMSAPPTSTQLFVMSHIDDILPSPSQEARELQGDPPTAVPEALKSGPLRTPIAIGGLASKDARPARQLVQQVAQVKPPMAPPPRPTTVKQPTVTVKQPTVTVNQRAANLTDIPFISTQDLIFSSQELRDLEAPTTSRNKTISTKVLPLKKSRPTVQQRPSPLSHISCHTHTTPQIELTQSTLAAEQHATPPNATRQPQQAFGQESCALDQQSSAHRSRQAPQQSKPALPSCTSSTKGDNKVASDEPPRPASPEKPRFFGSSGSGLEMLLAMERSRKTHEEEERRRLAQLRAEPDPADHISGSPKLSRGSQRVKLQNNGHGSPAAPRLQGKPRTTANNSPKSAHQDRAVTGGQLDPPTTVASQETDYGDLELDSMDFEELDRVLEEHKPGSQECEC